MEKIRAGVRREAVGYLLVLAFHVKAQGAAHRSHGSEVAVVIVQFVSRAGSGGGAVVPEAHPRQLGCGYAYLHGISDRLSGRDPQVLGVFVPVQGLGAFPVVKAYVFVLPAGGFWLAVIEARVSDDVSVNGKNALCEQHVTPDGEGGVGVAAGGHRGISSAYYVYVSFQDAVLYGSGVGQVGVPAEVPPQGLEGGSGGYYLDVGGRDHHIAAAYIKKSVSGSAYGQGAPDRPVKGFLGMRGAQGNEGGCQ